jgi:hypothetical protein
MQDDALSEIEAQSRRLAMFQLATLGSKDSPSGIKDTHEVRRGRRGFDLVSVIVPAPRCLLTVVHDRTNGQHGVDTLARLGKRLTPRWARYSEASEPHDG